MSTSTHTDRRYLLLILVSSIASIAYEITLLRLFSISFWYHFAFMVISIAMLGIGASGTFLAVFPSMKRSRSIPAYVLFFGIGIPLSYLIANAVPFDPSRLPWDRVQVLYVSIYYVILATPFFFFGLIVATAFSTMKTAPGHIYAADLGGAGIGAILSFILLYSGGPERIVFLLSTAVLLAAFISSGKNIKTLCSVFMVLNILLLFAGQHLIQQRISPYKPLQIALNYPGARHVETVHSPYARLDIFESPAARFAPGLSFRYRKDLPRQTGIAIDAGDIYAMTNERDKQGLAFVDFLPSALPYFISRKRDVLLLEPKGGLSVIAARQRGSRNIFAVDSNPLIIKTVRDYAKKMSSDLYETNTWSALGRSWLAGTDKVFDLIDLSIMGSMPSSSYGFSEDYRYTVEAFQTYIAHLKPDGFLSLNVYIIPPPRSELRILHTLVSASENMGIEDGSQHIAAIRSWGSITLLLKRSIITDRDITEIKKFCRSRRFDLLYYPGIREQESNIHIRMEGNEYFQAFRRIIDQNTRNAFVQNYLFDILPVHDENPFFHYYLKAKNLRSIYRAMGEKWQYFIEEGYLLPLLFLQALFLSIVFIILPVAAGIEKERPQFSLRRILPLSYFALLGVGFMFVELAFIQKMILSLETPPLAVSTVVASLLISSGLGGFLSHSVERLKKPSTLLFLSGIVFLYSGTMPLFMSLISPLPLTVKISLMFVTLMPAGILMGIPFPSGLSLLRAYRPELIPWAWAVNGCFSVLAPIIAVMLALSTGFSTIILLGAMMYLFGYLVLRRMQFEMT